MKTTDIKLRLLCVLGCWMTLAAGATEAQTKSQVWARIQLLKPRACPYTVQVVVRPAYGSNITFFVGQTVSGAIGGQYSPPPADQLKARENEVQPAKPKSPTGWADLTAYLPAGRIASVLFRFMPPQNFTNSGIKARFDIATAADDKAIVRSITEFDPGNVIALRIPSDPVKDKQWLLSIREDGARRLKEIQDLHLSTGPLPKKIWCMTGFRPWDLFTDPAITELNFDVIRALGMNGYWDMDAETCRMALARGIDRTTYYWRGVTPPGFGTPAGIALDWIKLSRFLDDGYRRDIAGTRRLFPDRMPMAIVDLMDEPAGLAFTGPEYDQEFRLYLQNRGFTPDFFGRTTWDEVSAVRTKSAYFWWDFFKTRAALDMTDLRQRRLFYWSGNFLCHVNARIYALANAAVEKYAPEVLGTRLNFGPPWWYDYGTIPRGIDAFETGRLRGVTLAFNEDWIGNGDSRWPLESNTMLADWNRAALRPNRPLAGGYVTRDANRAAVKLRVFGFLARDCKIFDFYYYGPAYGQFDHWSDNFPMVQGVAELTRDLGQADELLWEGHPPQAEVALLYSKSWPVWHEDGTELVEWMMTYLALLHAHVPVDIVSDDEAADGRFGASAYKALYVVNESVPAKAAAEIERWVRGGGRLWVAGWAGAKDEYNTPTAVWNDMLGIKERSWKPTGDLARLGQMVRYDDERRPAFNRQCRLSPPADAAEIPGANNLPYAAVAAPAGETPAKAYRRTHGAGLVQVVPWTAGKEYLDGNRIVDGTLAKGAILYPDDDRRNAIARFALDAVSPPATSSVSQILAWPLWARNGGAVLIANFTGNPAEQVTVRFWFPQPVKSLRSLRAGELKFDQDKEQQVTCNLPVKDVTDILVINSPITTPANK
jgi:hypothetical protein